MAYNNNQSKVSPDCGFAILTANCRVSGWIKAYYTIIDSIYTDIDRAQLFETDAYDRRVLNAILCHDFGVER
jgi:hypothetical protein